MLHLTPFVAHLMLVMDLNLLEQCSFQDVLFHHLLFLPKSAEKSASRMDITLQTVNPSLTNECQNGDSTKPDSTPRSLPNTAGFQTNHHDTKRFYSCWFPLGTCTDSPGVPSHRQTDRHEAHTFDRGARESDCAVRFTDAPFDRYVA